MKISIITVNYNNAEGLKRTLDSVASQTCREFEHIIIDGGSTDNSVDVIKEYVAKAERVIWSSEPDKGIYDGMNKGIAKASGEYLYFLNGGDTLVSPYILEEVAGNLDGEVDELIGRVNKVYKGRAYGKTNLLSEKNMSLYHMYLHGINHQSAFIKRTLLVRIPYDTSLRYGADWKFFVQTIVLGGATMKFVDITLANYDLSGVSNNTPAVRKEEKRFCRLLCQVVSREIITQLLLCITK